MGSAGKQLKDDPLGAIVNGFTNYVSMGFYGYSKDEGFTKSQGGNFHMYDEGIGEVTGRNVQREGIAQTDARATAAAQAAAQELANQRAAAAAADLQASDSAGAARANARAPVDGSRGGGTSGGSGGARGVMGQTLGGGNTDDNFLGL